MTTNAAYATFWAKARPPTDGAAVAFHPLVAHSLDVAAVAVLRAPRAARGLDARLLGFLVALHDIGKFSRPFQGKVEEHWPVEALGAFPAMRPPPGPPHDAMGLFLLGSTEVGDALKPVMAAWPASVRGHLWRALAGHHGRPPEPITLAPLQTQLCGGCRAAAAGFVEAMRDVFRPPPLPRPASEREAVRLAWHLAGLTTLADWVGSRREWFPYATAEEVADPAGYFWNRALPQAGFALAAAGLAHAEPASFGGVRKLFPGIDVPSPVQQWAENVTLPDGPVLATIEDLTGSGKTEAAIALAHRLMAAGRASGIYVALPTMATANAMYRRMEEAYLRLFVPVARPSLALAHGRAELNPRFRAAFDGGAAPRRAGAADPADDPAEAHCAAWLAEDRRKTLLAQVGVGTIDQALLAALPVRHATLRQHGLAGKVLIVDEAHAFDPYMRVELTALLRFHAALGGSAILLSATLPRDTRQHLADAFREGLGLPKAALSAEGYPLATLVAADGASETPCETREKSSRRVAVTRLEDAAAALDRIVAAANAGAAVAWVRNTVDDAIAAAALLRDRGIVPLLFHARFAMQDRLTIEAEVLRCFGRDSAGGVRARVLVATQIVEQSLDIDFDLLCTDLAPADLLIQRAGRLCRHDRGERFAELLVVSPDPVDDPPADWIAGPQPGTAAVYRDPALLWRSARAVFSRGAIATPGDMRPLIDEAGDRDNVPAALARPADIVQGKTYAEIGIADQNVLKVWDGYARNAGRWEPDDRTPTRLEDRPTVTLRLARVRAGAVVPYAEDADARRAWALSEVSVARFHIAECLPPDGLKLAVDKARDTWGRWERESDRLLLAVLTEADEGYLLDARAESGAAVVVAYSQATGLRLLPNAAK